MAAWRGAGATRGSCHRLPWAPLGTQLPGRDWGGGPGVPPAQHAQDTRGHIQHKWLSWAVPRAAICPAAAPCFQNKVYVVTESSPAQGLG